MTESEGIKPNFILLASRLRPLSIMTRPRGSILFRGGDNDAKLVSSWVILIIMLPIMHVWNN
jgi:hypothetical protein